jgi:hypothetical protein
MSYLDRLRALDAEKHLPEQPSKPSKAPFDPFEGSLSKCFSPKFEAQRAPAEFVTPAFDRGRLQADADRRNEKAVRERLTDRWCTCGARATFAWPRGLRCEIWRCRDCGPVRGEA